MKKQYIADNILIMRFSRNDIQGTYYLPECKITLPDHPVPVVFDHDFMRVVGTAHVWRNGNKLLANMTLTSEMKNGAEALRLLRLLYPSPEIRIIDAYENAVLAASLIRISLGIHENADERIKPLGDRVFCGDKSAKEGLH